MKTEIIKTEYVSEEEKENLYALFQTFYANTEYKRFLADFKEKQWLIRMSEGPRLAGFSTQQILELPIGGKPVRFLFSGDTIVHPDYWSKSHLAGAFGHLFLRTAAEAASPLYWFLISKGFRTYRFLPVFFNRFHPRHTCGDSDLKPLLDAVAAFKFGKHYNPETERITFTRIKDHLQGPLAEIPASRNTNPHIDFFIKRNPHYRTGTELACIAPLSKDNLTRCGKRVIRSTEAEWHE